MARLWCVLTRWARLMVSRIKSRGELLRRRPNIVILPLIALGLMVGLGVWGVMAASTDSANTKKRDATSSAAGVATGFQVNCMSVCRGQSPTRYWSS